MSLDIDPERKCLVTFNKSGCCQHFTEEYEVIPQKGLFKVHEEAAILSMDGEEAYFITPEWLNGTWKETGKQ